jgi:hypothetical protein
MKILFSVIIGIILLFFWVVNGGYKYIPASKSIGTEYYAKNDISSSTPIEKITNIISKAKPKETFVATTTEEVFRFVTHIKTPEHVKAIYMSSWVAGSPSIRAPLVKLIEETELNALVIDVKDNTGVITWEGRAKDLNDFIDELHSKNIYVIARISAFQDPLYVKYYPDQAVKSKSTGEIWKDNKGVPWVDTGSQAMWKYIENVSKDAYARGFDEINLDYIRFPTDGKLTDMVFPISGERAKTDKPGIVGDFYRYITDALRKENIPVSGDIFGIVLVTKVDIPTLGQDAHVALETFDYVSPMVYPSHFYTDTAGYKNPAAHPGEMITFAMEKGLAIADEVASSTGQATSTIRAKYRPFYQDFDMGATYTKELVRAQIDAGEKLGIKSWMLWDPSNKYTPTALKNE